MDVKSLRIRHDRCYHPHDKATRDACAAQQREYDNMLREMKMGRYAR